MDLSIARAALQFSRRRRRWLILLAAASATGYGAYKIYHLPAVRERRRRLARLLRAMVSLAEAFSSSAETFELLSNDVNRFLRSDRTEMPPSLRQISKIAASQEFSTSVSRISESVSDGILRGLRQKSLNHDLTPESSVSERLLDKIFSAQGSDFASTVAGNFARTLVSAIYSSQSETASTEHTLPTWIHLICSERVRILLGDCIQAFVSTAVSVYLDKTMDLNAFDDLFSGLTNPKHETKTKELLISLCNNAVETLIKTSHRLLTTSAASSSSTDRDDETDQEAEMKKNSGWVDAMSSTLSVPTNRRLVLDVTGRVASETVKSLVETVPRSVTKIVRGEMAEKGSEVMRYVAQKSLLSMTICFALCLHVFYGTRVLV